MGFQEQIYQFTCLCYQRIAILMIDIYHCRFSCWINVLQGKCISWNKFWYFWKHHQCRWIHNLSSVNFRTNFVGEFPPSKRIILHICISPFKVNHFNANLLRLQVTVILWKICWTDGRHFLQLFKCGVAKNICHLFNQWHMYQTQGLVADLFLVRCGDILQLRNEGKIYSETTLVERHF